MPADEFPADIDAWIDAVVAAAPPLTNEQIESLRRLFRPPCGVPTGVEAKADRYLVERGQGTLHAPERHRAVTRIEADDT